MMIRETSIPGCFHVIPEKRCDERGAFYRTFCEQEFSDLGLESRFEQQSISHSVHAGTVRGMHFSRPPMAETKLVRVVQGAILDVVIDLRHQSPTYLQQMAIELDAEQASALYVPIGCAHGFQTLVDHTSVLYSITPSFELTVSDGLCWNDEASPVSWPLPVVCIAAKDLAWPAWKSRALVEFQSAEKQR